MTSTPDRSRPLTRPGDQLTEQDINDLFSRFAGDLATSQPPGVIFDNLISLIRPLYCSRITLLDQTLVQQRFESLETTAQFQDKLRAVKTRAAEKRQELVSATEINYNRKIEDLRNQAAATDTRHALVVDQLRNQAAATDTRHTQVVDQLRNQAAETETRYAQAVNELRQQAAETETRYAQLVDQLRQQAAETEARHILAVTELRQQDAVIHELRQHVAVTEARCAAVEARCAQDLENNRLNLAAMEARCAQEIQMTKNDHTTQRQEWIKQLNAANIRNQQSMEMILLRQPITQAAPIKGSQTRAASWAVIKNTLGNKFNVTLPTNPVTVATMEHVTANIRQQLLSRTFNHEKEMYSLVCELLGAGLNHNKAMATVYDTSRLQYLEGNLPDLTIGLPGTIEPDSLSVCVVVDMKQRTKNTPNREIKKLGTGNDFGQMSDYLIAVQAAQPGRTTCVALLSDIDRNYVITLGAPECESRVVQYAVVSLSSALAYIHDTALQNASHLPPHPGFSAEAGDLRRRLGNPHHSVVGEFLVPGTTTGAVMAVKRTTTKTSERFFLEMFKEDSSRPACIPLIVYNNPNEIEYGITPVGTTLRPGIHANSCQMRTILTDVITATKWLHDRRIVHRDIRCENIVLADGHAILIDFDASFFLKWSLPTTYRGGKLCVPPRYLEESLVHGMNHRYFPALSDDCYAILLLVYCLLFPARFADFRTATIGYPGSPDGAALLEFWRGLAASPLWKRYIVLAEGGEVNYLMAMLEIFY